MRYQRETEYKNYITGIMTKSPIYVIVNTG